MVNLRQYTQEQIDQAENCFIKYLEWERQNPFEVIAAEKSLVSNTMKYGGTLDLLCQMGKDTVLIDFKSSKAVYDENAYQLAGYDFLLKEDNGITCTKWMIVRIGRDDNEGFEVRSYDSMEQYWEVFKAALTLYYAIQKTKGRE